jgi:hypothetical protein
MCLDLNERLYFLKTAKDSISKYDTLSEKDKHAVYLSVLKTLIKVKLNLTY